MNFYHELYSFYDDMINFSHRLETEKVIFKNILKNHPAHSALDIGCGSGFHTILLSKLGLVVTGLDNSSSMLKLAEKNSQKYGVNSSFRQGDFLVLDSHLQDSFDALFCLGNSFVHLLTEEDQIKSLQNFRQYLKKGGYLCLQIVNYDKILKNKQNILAERTINNQKITRSYSFKEKTVLFNVKLQAADTCKEISTELFPMTSSEINSLLQNTGFRDIQFYGDLKYNPYKQYESENICVFCRFDR